MANKYWNIVENGVVVKQVWSSGDTPYDYDAASWTETLTQVGKIGSTYDGNNWEDPVVSLADLRAERDIKLADCDWIIQRHKDQLDDGGTTTINTAKFDEWIDYRQSLRDITNGYAPMVEASIGWPTEPS